MWVKRAPGDQVIFQMLVSCWHGIEREVVFRWAVPIELPPIFSGDVNHSEKWPTPHDVRTYRFYSVLKVKLPNLKPPDFDG